MIPFNKTYLTGKEETYIKEALSNGKLSGDGTFTKKCHAILESSLPAKKVLLTHSCTAALEMAAILTDIQPGDEFILPSYTFVSTANAFVLRGGTPVFVDIRPDTLNIDETKIESAITEKTKAIVAVHYAGVGCEMDEIMRIAQKHGLLVIEDAAQAVGAYYKNRHLGTIGHLGCFSFHETKNIICGEGGALIINDERFMERAEIIREKGTNRSRFLRGQVDKYSWVDIGSSFLPSELNAAFLLAQLENEKEINSVRLKHWDYYHRCLLELEQKQFLKRPTVPDNCKHNAHMYYIIVKENRDSLINYLKENGISAVSHYVPLHSSTFMKKMSLAKKIDLKETDRVSENLLRLPMYSELNEQSQRIVIDCLNWYFNDNQVMK